jgi:hypothetical protein
MSQDHNILRNCLKSLAKWKRDAEAWYKQDSAMFKGLLHMVEANVVCVSRICVKPSLLIQFIPGRQREMIIEVWQQR